MKAVSTYKEVSIFSNVPSACSKNPYTMLLLNSRSSSSSSISRICSKVSWSIESPHSRGPVEPASDFDERISLHVYDNGTSRQSGHETYRIFCQMSHIVFVFRIVLLFCWDMFRGKCDLGYGAELGHCERCSVVNKQGAFELFLLSAKRRIE